MRLARSGKPEAQAALREHLDQIMLQEPRPAKRRRIDPTVGDHSVVTGGPGREEAANTVQTLVFDESQSGSGVSEVEALVRLPAGTPGSDLDAVAYQVAQEIGAIGVALADKRHVVDARFGIRTVDPRIGRQLNPHRPRADSVKIGQRRAFGDDTQVEPRRNVADQIELVHVVAREIDRRYARLANDVDRLGIDHRAVEVAKEEVDRAVRQGGPKRVEQTLVGGWLARALPGRISVIRPTRKVEAHQLVAHVLERTPEVEIDPRRARHGEENSHTGRSAA